MKKGEKIECINANTTVEDFYDVINNCCPVCDRKIITPVNGFVYGGKIYHLNCVLDMGVDISK